MNMGGGVPAGFQIGYKVRMQGIPFNVAESDIAEWFSSVVDPVKVRINYNNDGRPSGNADVLFATEDDAQKAMSKHKENMQHRYVELYYDGQVMAPAAGGAGEVSPWSRRRSGCRRHRRSPRGRRPRHGGSRL